MSIRDVRPTDDFYRDVDQALVLASEVMSRSEFGLYVLPGVLGRFATGWDELPMPIPGRPDYRVLIGYSGHLGVYAIEGQMAWDGVIEAPEQWRGVPTRTAGWLLVEHQEGRQRRRSRE